MHHLVFCNVKFSLCNFFDTFYLQDVLKLTFVLQTNFKNCETLFLRGSDPLPPRLSPQYTLPRATHHPYTLECGTTAFQSIETDRLWGMLQYTIPQCLSVSKGISTVGNTRQSAHKQLKRNSIPPMSSYCLLPRRSLLCSTNDTED